MQVEKLTFNPFGENTYILFDESKKAIIIDPGIETEDEQKFFEEYIKKNSLIPEKIVCTHLHIDHLLGVDFLKSKYNIKFYANKKDEYLNEQSLVFAEMYDLNLKSVPEIDFDLTENDILNFGNCSLNIFEVPGHTKGHIALFSEKDKIIFTGDVLFKNSIGRTDLPGGDLDTLIKSIFTKIFTLDEDFIVYPGHGESTTIGEERKTNPYL